MKNIIWIILAVALHAVCYSMTPASLEAVQWEIGTFSDLKKIPISVVLTNSEPNLVFTNTIYQQDYSEGAVQIVELIRSAEEEEDDPNIPFFILPEQLWIVFNDGSGSVFPYAYEPYASIVRSIDGVRISEELDDLMEWIRVCHIDRQPQKVIPFEEVRWKKGQFSDLTKKAIGLVTSDAEPNLVFAKAREKDDLSEEAARIAYLFGNDPLSEDFTPSRPWNQQMWIAFEDGTGSVFECYDQSFNETYIRVGNTARRSEAAKSLLDMVRRRDRRIRKEIREGKKEPCPVSDPIEP